VQAESQRGCVRWEEGPLLVPDIRNLGVLCLRVSDIMTSMDNLNLHSELGIFQMQRNGW
jgi:hypothetical protein